VVDSPQVVLVASPNKCDEESIQNNESGTSASEVK